MNELLDILNEIDDTIDYENETKLIDDHLLDSFFHYFSSQRTGR